MVEVGMTKARKLADRTGLNKRCFDHSQCTCGDSHRMLRELCIINYTYNITI